MTLVPEASTGVNSAWAGSAVLVGPRAVPGASTDFFAAALLSSTVQFYVWVGVVPSFVGVCPAEAGAGSAPRTPSFSQRPATCAALALAGCMAKHAHGKHD